MNILITAGPTREYLDDVRFLSNGSSGKMGYAIATESIQREHVVRLISGPVEIKPPDEVELIKVVTAENMLNAVKKNIEWCDVLIMCAAVADFRPAEGFSGKIRKSEMPEKIQLSPNPDILKAIADLKGNRIFIGFAAESGPPIKSASRKLTDKKLDMIVANDISLPDAGFGTDTNKIVLIDTKGLVKDYPVMTKQDAAGKILDWLASR